MKNTEGNTPLHIAASAGKVTLCRRIIEISKSKILLQGFRNKEGETPLFKAVLHGHKDAFLYLHSILDNKEDYEYCERNDGETILHCAITEEYYDLSFKILELYKKLVNFVNTDGMTPLHLLASKPSAFKSGCDLPWFENIIYHTAFIPELPRADKHDEENLEGRQVTQGGRHQTDEENPEGRQVTHGGDPSPNDVPRHQLLTLYYRACFLIIELVSKAVLIIFGSEMEGKVKEKKERHTWSYSIMNKMLEKSSMYQFSTGKSSFPSTIW
ncbi:putative 26s proteasome regulatory subunit p28 [Fagus crenata]